ncbi:MAG: DGQHR domain-containing protein [Pigmentiphaga sp.]
MSIFRRSIDLQAIRINQPIGEFFIAAISARDLVDISFTDVREMRDSALDLYMGIQRRLSPARSKDLQTYVNQYDATFPTAIILAVDEKNALWNEEARTLTLVESDEIEFGKIARIIDGQHRVDGLTNYKGDAFEVNVSIFVGTDIATQANIFATVNLAQTKVNRSLVYDLLDYEKKRSPQKTAHHITVALDKIPDGPFYHRIKRLGTATAGRENETLTQAAVVEALLPYIATNPQEDRNSFLGNLFLARPSRKELERCPFRGLFLQEKDTDITRIILEFFNAVREKWPTSWDATERQGNVLPKTNGFKALMRFLRPAYLSVVGDDIGRVPHRGEFSQLLDQVRLMDDDFNIQTFPPGTSGEAKLFNLLMDDVFPGRGAAKQGSLF